ncbi:hypothetical protein KC19_4G200100 [Ceratodon purpureus]|uniref:Uncharacterized protein n=1 Tax=Ceratodon purpureus TaxID=3225 RepID=A0A8T0ID29_CERPU|nr:hypothetical protein KC19_4G200100 [Ceratodon purpureus]
MDSWSSIKNVGILISLAACASPPLVTEPKLAKGPGPNFDLLHYLPNVKKGELPLELEQFPNCRCNGQAPVPLNRVHPGVAPLSSFPESKSHSATRSKALQSVENWAV